MVDELRLRPRSRKSTTHGRLAVRSTTLPAGTREVHMLRARVGLKLTAILSPLVMSLGFAAAAIAQLEIGGRGLDIEATLKELGAEVVEEEIRIALAADVLFDVDRHDLKRSAIPTLTKVGEVLNAHPNTAVVIEGYTDGMAAEAYNKALSQRRAASVRDWLVKNAKQPASRFTTRGSGKSRLIAPNSPADGSDDPEGRQKTSRVEIIFKKE